MEDSRSIVAFQFNEKLEEGVILHILQDTDKGTERYKIDMVYDTFKQMLNRAYGFCLKHPELIDNE